MFIHTIPLSKISCSIKLGALCLFALNITSVYGQVEASPGSFPLKKHDASFLYHSGTRSLLLVGGFDNPPDQFVSDVWKWDGKSWTRISASGPGSRFFFPAAINSKGIIYAFGGQDYVDTPKEDVWLFDGRKWSPVETNNKVTRDHHQMVYADHLDAFVVYGGQNTKRDFDSTTYLMKDGKFTALNIPGPGLRYHSNMAYDKSRNKVVLYGGGVRPGEHWEFDGTQWKKIITKINPGKKLYHEMVYDEDKKMVILLGGMQNQDPRDPINAQTPITWGYDGTSWKKIAESRIFPLALGYDPVRKVTVAFGQSSNEPTAKLGLWELTLGKWLKIADYGPARN